MMGEVKDNGNQGEIMNSQDPTGEKQAQKFIMISLDGDLEEKAFYHLVI